MAIYNEILVARYARMLQKLFGTKGGVPTKQLAGEIMSVFPIFAGVENRYLEGWERFGVGLIIAANVATKSGVQLRNPAGSNVVAVIEKMTVQTQGPQERLSVGVSFAAQVELTNPVGVQALDSRGRATGSLIASTSNNTTDLTVFFGIIAAANAIPYDVILDENQELPMLPGTTYRILGENTNTDLTINLIWRERILEESERA
jgi:hypothetical protein